MPTIRTRLYPLADQNQHEVISLYSTLNTGLAGTLVKISTGTANPQNADGWSNNPVGISIANTASFRYETKFKVIPSVSGDNAYNVLGITQLSTLEVDENGIPLRYNGERAREIGAVISGETVPIITKASILGIWGNYIDQSLGNIQPGNVVVPSRSGNGLIAAIDPASFAFTGVYAGSSAVIGKWLTSLPTATNTGLANEFSAQGGYALFSLDCNF